VNARHWMVAANFEVIRQCRGQIEGFKGDFGPAKQGGLGGTPSLQFHQLEVQVRGETAAMNLVSCPPIEVGVRP